MNSDNGRVWYSIGVDTTQLRADVEKIKKEFRSIGATAETQGTGIDRTFRNIAAGASAYLSLRFAAQIGKEIISVRGEFQQLGIAFETMLGSKAKADKLMSEAVVFAQKTPFTLTDVASNVKQLMAMGIETEKVMDTMKSLGDVAAGVSVPISRVAINYGQVAALGRLQQREIRDFAMAGIPLVEELAKQLGKTTAEINSMVTNSQIGFPEVEKAFQSMSGEGGKFYNLMEKQNASVTGQISNLQDKMQVMLNSIGKSNEGLIYGGIAGLSNLVENYQEVLDVLKVLVGTLGAYKAAIVAINVFEKIQAKNEAIRASIIEAKIAAINKNIAAEEAAIQIEQQRATMEAANSRREQTNSTIRIESEAKVIAAKEASALATQTLIAAEQNYAITFARNQQLMQKGLLTSSQEAAQKKELAAIETLRTNVRKANAAVDNAISKQTSVNARIEAEAVTQSEAEKAAARKVGIAASRQMQIESLKATAAEVKAAKAQSFFNKTLLNNPYVIAATGLAFLVTTLISFRKSANDAYNAGTDYNKTLNDQYEQLNRLFDKVKKAKEGTNDHTRAIDDANKFLKEYNVSLTDENGNLVDLKDAYKNATDAIDLFVAKQAKAKELQDASEILNSNSLKNLQGSQTGYGALGTKLTGADVKVLQDIIKQNSDLIAESIIYDPLQKVATLVKGGRFEELQKQISESISGNTTLEDIYKYDTQSLLKYISQTSEQFGEYRDRIEEINSFYDPLLENNKKGKESFKTIQKQIEETSKSLSEAKEKLKELRDPDYKSSNSLKEIQDQETVIKELQSKLEALTGIKKKEAAKQQKTEEEKLKALQELAEKELEIKQTLEESKVSVLKDGIEKQRKQAELAHKEDLIRIRKQEQEYLKTLNESKGLKVTDSGYITDLPANVKADFDDQKTLSEQEYNNRIVQINKNAAESVKNIWNEATEGFISDVEAQERSINEKYDSLIKKAKELGASQGFIDDLEDKRNAALSKVVVVDWIDAFGELDKLSTETLDSMRDKLKQYISQLSNDLNKDELKELVKTFEELDSAINGRKPLSTLVDSIKDYKFQTQKIEALKEQLKYYKEQKADLLVISRLEEKIRNAESDRAKSADKTTQALNAIGQQGGEIVSSMQEFTDMLGNYGVEVGEQGNQILDGVGQMMDGLASIDLTRPASIISGVVKTLAGAGNYWAGLFGIGPDNLSEDVFKRYDDLMSTMDELISKQTELLDALAGAEATAAHEEAVNLINKRIQATKQLGNEYLNSGAGMFSSSKGVRVRKDLQEFAGDFDKIGISFESLGGRMTGLFDLSPDQLRTIKEEMPEAWAKLDDQTREYLQTLIDSDEELDGLGTRLDEVLTGITFDSARDSLKDLLADADTTMADVANNFQKYMKNAIVDLIVDGALSDKLKEWYSSFSDAMSDGVLDSDEKNKLQQFYKDIYAEGVNMRDMAAEAAGIDFGSSSTSSGLTGSIQRSLTEETGGELAGLWRKSSDDTRMIRDYSKEIRDSARSNLEKLTGIEVNTFNTVAELKNTIAELKDSNLKLDQIATNTKSSQTSRDLGV